MELHHPEAFRPLLTASVTILVSAADGADKADAVTLPASVMEGNAEPNPVGNARRAELWVVQLVSSDYRGRLAISRGCRVEPDPAGAWPTLTVQAVRRNGGLTILECSGRERGPQ